MRSFSAPFETQKNLKATPAPFLTVVYRFGGGAPDLWLSDRGRPVSISGHAMNPIILSFGEIGTAIARAPEIVDVGDTTLSFINFPVLVGGYGGRRFSDCFGSDIEAVLVDFYLNFADPDDPDTILASEIFASGVSRFNFRDQSAFFDEEVGAIVVTSLTEKWWQRSVLKEASLADYPNIGTDSVGKHFPLPMGDPVAVPGLRLDATADRFTIAESDPANVVTSIGQLYWNGHPFSENDIAFGIPEGSSYYNIDLENGMASPAGIGGGSSGQYFFGGSDGTSSVFIDPSSASGSQVSFFVPFMPWQDTILQWIQFSLSGGPITPPTTAEDIVIHIKKFGNSGFVLDSHEVALTNGPVLQQFYCLLQKGVKYEVEMIFNSNALGAGYTIDAAFEPNVNFQGEFATASSGRAPLSTFPGVGAATTIAMNFGGLPFSGQANLASSSDPLGVSAASGQLITDTLESPGVVLAGFRAALRVPATRDDKLSGDLKIELLSLQNGQSTSIASTVIGADEFMSAIADADLGTYVDFYETLDEPVFVPAGRVGVSITNQMSAQQIADQAAAIADGSAPIFTTSGNAWRIQGWSNPVLGWSGVNWQHATITYSSGAGVAIPTGGPSATPAMGASNVPIKINMLLYVMKFNRYPNSAVQTVEGTSGSFNVASVKPQPVPYQISSTRRVPIPDGTVISGDLTCTYSRCDQVIHAQATRAGIADGRIDLSGTFSAAGTKYSANGYRFDGVVTTQQTYKQLFAREGFECRSVVDWQWDKMQLKWTPGRAEVTTSAKTFDRTTIVPKNPQGSVSSLKIARTTETEIVNVIPARWNLNPTESKYHAAKRYQSDPSIADYGELRAQEGLFDFLYVRTNSMIDSVCANKLERMAYSKKIMHWEAFLDALGLEKDTDAVDFDMSIDEALGTGVGEGSVGTGGWGGSVSGGISRFGGLAVGTFALIEQVSYNWKNFKTILLQAREL